MYPWPSHHIWGVHGVWWLFGVLLLILLLFIVARAMRPAKPRTPRDVLDDRYAAGEISTEEYEDRRRRLRGSE